MESRQGTAADTVASLFPAAVLLQHTSVVINTLTAARRLTPCCQPATARDKHTPFTFHTCLHCTVLLLNERKEMLVQYFSCFLNTLMDGSR